MSEPRKIEPRGLVAILTAADGSVIATATDFEPGRLGGCSLHESQRMRLERLITFKAVAAYCADAVANVVSDYQCQEIVRQLRLKGGHRLVYRGVGYADEIEAEIKGWGDR